ncbi:phage/plasmid primase, P4 family [Streptomyces sp. NPDC094143]|uniref:DNA primase family protein n=1 Tax=Streptomyces sp. NPDC094143 TaxID=3155310 RepID=UPI003319B41C
MTIQAPHSPGLSLSAGGLLPDTLTDHGDAKLFVELYSRMFRHVPGLGWYRWAGHRWKADENATVIWTAGEMADRLALEDPTGRFTTADLARHRRRALSTAGIKAMLSQAACAPGMTLSASLLDADPLELCTPAGVVDLRDGSLSPSDPLVHRNSRSTTVAPRQMPTPRWDAFLRDTFGDDGDGAAMRSYVQLLLGYSVTGEVGAQVLPFCYGRGSNGKSVLMEVMIRILGDYADAAPPGFLLERSYDAHPTDLAELRGRRLVVCAELGPHDRFDEARVQYLTSADQLSARHMRGQSFSFTPTHKLWLLGNHRPEVVTGGPAFWRRMRLLPFDRVVDAERRVDNLARVMVAEEGPGILRWLLHGALRYVHGERDLSGPRRVREATAAYAETEDHTGRFLAERRVCAGAGPAGGGRLYAEYRRWCRFEGEPPVSARDFIVRFREVCAGTRPASPRTSPP